MSILLTTVVNALCAACHIIICLPNSSNQISSPFVFMVYTLLQQHLRSRTLTDPEQHGIPMGFETVLEQLWGMVMTPNWHFPTTIGFIGNDARSSIDAVWSWQVSCSCRARAQKHLSVLWTLWAEKKDPMISRSSLTDTEGSWRQGASVSESNIACLVLISIMERIKMQLSVKAFTSGFFFHKEEAQWLYDISNPAVPEYKALTPFPKSWNIDFVLKIKLNKWEMHTVQDYRLPSWMNGTSEQLNNGCELSLQMKGTSLLDHHCSLPLRIEWNNSGREWGSFTFLKKTVL